MVEEAQMQCFAQTKDGKDFRICQMQFRPLLCPLVEGDHRQSGALFLATSYSYRAAPTIELVPNINT